MSKSLEDNFHKMRRAAYYYIEKDDFVIETEVVNGKWCENFIDGCIEEIDYEPYFYTLTMFKTLERYGSKK